MGNVALGKKYFFSKISYGGVFFDVNGNAIDSLYAKNEITAPNGAVSMRLSFLKSDIPFGGNLMINSGSSLLPYEPYLDGCTFIGWTSTQGGTTITIPTVNELMSMVDVTLYAVFATHYYVKFSDYPLQEVSTDGNADYNIRTNAADYYIDVLRNPDSGYGIVVAKAVLPTNNCNKVRVKYTAYNGVDRQICGTYVDAGSSSITFNCSGDTFELTMRVVNSDSGNWATMTISEVYFYYEK